MTHHDTSRGLLNSAAFWRAGPRSRYVERARTQLLTRGSLRLGKCPLTSFISLLGILLSGPASAQDLTTHDTWLLEPQPGTFYANGIGSPTVAYDDVVGEWVMYFETQYGPIDPECRQGRWGIGRATSPDGFDWSVDADLVLSPAADTYYGCVLAHPTVLFDGDQWHLWFKAHQSSEPCVDSGLPEPTWGCEAVTGVGYATSPTGTNFNVTPQPIINLSSFGFPTVTRVDGVYRMLLAFSNARNQIFELWQSVSLDDGATWSTPQYVIGPGFALWVENEIYNPSLTCDEDITTPAGPYILFAGGRNRDQNPDGSTLLLTAGMGRAYSNDAVNWFWDEGEPLISWNLATSTPERDWRHWDVVRNGDDFLFFFSEKDDEGRNRVGLAYTYPGQQAELDTTEVANRICSEPGVGDSDDPNDTDNNSDTDDRNDTDDPNDTDDANNSSDTDDTDDDTDDNTGETDRGTPKGSGSCGCRSIEGAWGWWLLLPLFLVRRRR
jgi:hypothetical protein